MDDVSAIGPLSLEQKGFELIRLYVPPAMQVGDGLPEDAMPVYLPNGDADPIVDAVEFYPDKNNNALLLVQVGRHMLLRRLWK